MTTYHHFCEVALGNWTPDNRYHTPDDTQNLYWRKVFARTSYEHSLARSAASPGHAGSAQEQFLARALAAKEYLIPCFRELLFEMVRQEVAPQLPSRSSCLFLVEPDADLTACASRYGFGEARRMVVEVEALDGSRICRAHAALLDTTIIAEDILRSARQYWKEAAPDTPPDEVEILLAGPFRIRRVVRAGLPITTDGRSMDELLVR
jgi:hypothetical protein